MGKVTDSPIKIDEIVKMTGLGPTASPQATDPGPSFLKELLLRWGCLLTAPSKLMKLSKSLLIKSQAQIRKNQKINRSITKRPPDGAGLRKG